jgi:hypothetical protein
MVDMGYFNKLAWAHVMRGAAVRQRAVLRLTAASCLSADRARASAVLSTLSVFAPPPHYAFNRVDFLSFFTNITFSSRHAKFSLNSSQRSPAWQKQLSPPR